MKKDVRLYNVLFPIWLLVLFPQVLVFLIPGNLAIDCLVLFCALCALKHAQKGAVLKELWWKFWLLGFAADALGVLWMILSVLPAWIGNYGTVGSSPLVEWWEKTMLGVHMLRPWTHPLTFCWTLAGVAIAGAAIYFFDKRAMRKCDLLTEREKHIVALTMAMVTAPWLFFLPLY